LEQFGEELRFLFITSGAEVRSVADRPFDALGVENVWVRAVPVTDAKCVRCWQRRPDIGTVAAHPELCGRCVTNLDGGGETRRFV
jgi:isoleucyl-tRNA synthetase